MVFRRQRDVHGQRVTLYATDPRGPWSTDLVHLHHYAERIDRLCRGEADVALAGGRTTREQQAERARWGHRRRGLGPRRGGQCSAPA